MNPSLDTQKLDLEIIDVDEADLASPEASSVSYFGAEFDAHGLVRRLDDDAIIIPSFDPQIQLPDEAATGFQRRYVWRKAQMDRFIESLLLEFPVPGIFLVQQPGKKYLVLDGQQRLTTLRNFYTGTVGDKAFKLENVDETFKGLTYRTLTDEQRRTLDDTFIHAIVIRQPATPEDYENVYQIFERLNSGGTNLQPQEIRVALYNGALVDLIRGLNENGDWRELYGKPSERLKDQELILRFLALWLSRDSYSRPLKTFLNDFLGDHREGQGLDLVSLSATFAETCAVLREHLGRPAFRREAQVNAALVDAVMVGLATRLARGPLESPERLAELHATLLGNSEFATSITRATADEDSVKTRIDLAVKALSQL